MKKTLPLALLAISTNTFAALQCPSNSTVIYSNDWHKYQTAQNIYVIDSSIGPNTKPICLSTSPNPTPTAPMAGKENPTVYANVMTFNYPVVFNMLSNYTIVGEDYNLSESNINPAYSPSYLRIPYFVSNFGSSNKKKPTITVNESHNLKLYYIRAQNNAPTDGDTVPSLKVQTSNGVKIKHAEIVGANGVLSIDSSNDLKATATGIVCKYFCIANSASPRTLMEQVSIRQNFSEIPHDTHATITLQPNGLGGEPSTISFTRSNFLIETGTAFAVATLTGLSNSDRMRPISKVTVDNSRFEINKASNTLNKAYGWSQHHVNYGLLEINITSNNTFMHHGLVGKFLSAPTIQAPSNLVSRLNNNNIPYFYQDEDYTPAHYVIKSKLAGDSDSKFITVCIGGLCRVSTDPGIRNFQQVANNLPSKTYTNGNPDPTDNGVALCQTAKGFYSLAQLNHIEKVCNKMTLATRITADNT